VILSPEAVPLLPVPGEEQAPTIRATTTDPTPNTRLMIDPLHGMRIIPNKLGYQAELVKGQRNNHRGSARLYDHHRASEREGAMEMVKNTK
jgi:hypothetical protein